MRDETKVPKEWQSYYDDLMSLRNSLKGALGARSDETLGASARESSGELSINSSDSGTEAFNRDVALSMVASEQEALEEIEDAIDRIFDGTFGICQETKKPIKKARLKVVPFTRFSLEGQTQYEQRNRKDRDAGGGVFATIADSTMGQDD
jgi:RNA polymerase-binding transcription factor DksA